MNLTWTDDRIEALKLSISAGLTASQASRALEGAFSRSACLSKAKRLGLHFLSGMANGHTAQEDVGKAAPKRSSQQPSPPRIIAPATDRDALIASQRAMDATNLGVSLTAVGANQCRFPLNDALAEDHRVCGAPAPGESSWCVGHRAMVYQPVRERPVDHQGKRHA